MARQSWAGATAGGLQPRCAAVPSARGPRRGSWSPSCCRQSCDTEGTKCQGRWQSSAQLLGKDSSLQQVQHSKWSLCLWGNSRAPEGAFPPSAQATACQCVTWHLHSAALLPHSPWEMRLQHFLAPRTKVDTNDAGFQIQGSITAVGLSVNCARMPMQRTCRHLKQHCHCTAL